MQNGFKDTPRCVIFREGHRERGKGRGMKKERE